MSLRHRFGILAVAAVFAFTGCSDTIDDLVDPGGEGTLNQAGKAALINALNTSGVLAGSPAALYSTLVVGLLNDVGTLSASQARAINEAIESGIRLAVSNTNAASYEGAVGVQVGWDITGSMGWFVGVIGWNGLDIQTQTVSELVAVYDYNMESNQPPSTATMTIGEDPNSTAVYWDGSSTFHGTSGDAAVTGSSFSGNTDCSQVGLTCSYSTGAMNGNFEFVGSDVAETAGSYTQSPINFSGLPSVKIDISR